MLGRRPHVALSAELSGALNAAMSDILTSPDWEANLRIVDMVNSETSEAV